MPFIPKTARYELDKGSRSPQTSGEICYKFYADMMDKWRRCPSWTTADRIYNEVMEKGNWKVNYQRGKELAWQVFFQLHVMPYELEKQKENGDIK
jgi:hypothetical protein